MPGVAMTGTPMLTAYITAALAHAQLRRLEDGSVFAEIPELPGVWAAAASEDECRAELQSVLEDWIALGLALGHPFPPIDGHTIEVRAVASGE